MNLSSRSVFFLAIVMLLIILLPALTGTGIVGLTEDDELPDDDFSVIVAFPVAWTRIPVHQMSALLRLGISIFALFVVYLGGRSKAKRFNDRTIELIKSLIRIFSKTALIRAVFNFLFFDPYPEHTKTKLMDVILFPTLIPNRRRY